MLEMYDMSQFHRHAKEQSGNADGECCKDTAYLLRFWRAAKEEYLYKLLGHELILSKPFTYERAYDEMFGEMEEIKRQHYWFLQRIREKLEAVLHPNWGCSWSGSDRNSDAKFIDSIMNLFNSDRLIDGRIGIENDGRNAIIMGREVRLTVGQKVMRAIGRVAELLDLTADFEAFRIAHSQVLNQKRVSGTLHLSIHPLDYATASDNVNDWDSCMSWYNEGCYRLGTVEMMNSPMVICAYLTGKNVMQDVGGADWNSKKWRAWVVVNKDIILLNRQYPYANNSIAMEAVNWVRQLALENVGWEYQTPCDDLLYRDYGFSFETNYMYNDISNDHPGCVGEHISCNTIFKHHNHYINFSGKAECMWCGREIEYDEGIDAGTLTCPECNGASKCSCCGGIIYGEGCWGPDDQFYCEDCYNELFSTCDYCNDTIRTENAMTLEFPIIGSNMRKYLEEIGEESRAYQDYFFTNYLGIKNVYLPYNVETTICKECLTHITGHTASASTLRNVDYPEHHMYHYTQMRYALDPSKVNFDQFFEIFKPYDTWKDTDGSFRIVWEKLWKDYIQYLSEIGKFEW